MHYQHQELQHNCTPSIYIDECDLSRLSGAHLGCCLDTAFSGMMDLQPQQEHLLLRTIPHRGFLGQGSKDLALTCNSSDSFTRKSGT